MKLLLTVFITMSVIVDPIGNTPVFLALSRALSDDERRRAALKAVLTAFVIIVGFAVFGQLILAYLRISVASLSIAGGLLLLLVALEMMQGRLGPFAVGAPEAGAAEPGTADTIAFVPLGTPLLAGPGAIVAVMLFVTENVTVAGRLLVFGGVALALLTVWLTLRYAVGIERRLGPGAVSVLTRLMGLILAAIAAQFVIDGVKAVV